MNNHLSNEQFAKYAVGECDLQTQDHLSGCAACRSEVQRFQFAVGDLRTFMHQVGDQECWQPSLQVRWPSPRWSLSFVHSAAIVFGFMLILFFAGGRLRPKPAPPDAPTFHVPFISDAQLWAEVEVETSRTVAPAMDALLGSAEQSGPATYQELGR
jgi:hypothetical protein